MLDDENAWSDWADCNENTVSSIPPSEGVYMMHESVKILCIEGTQNIKKSIEERLSQPCVTNNTRLRYMKTPSYERVANNLIKEYKSRHEGKLPSCMQ